MLFHSSRRRQTLASAAIENQQMHAKRTTQAKLQINGKLCMSRGSVGRCSMYRSVAMCAKYFIIH